MAVGYLVQVVGRSRLLLQTAAVTDRVTNLRLDYAGDLSPEVAEAIDDVQSLAGLRASLVAGTADVEGVLTQFTAVIGRLIDALRLMDAADATTAEGRQLLALDALLRVDEGNSAGAALMTVMVATRASVISPGTPPTPPPCSRTWTGSPPPGPPNRWICTVWSRPRSPPASAAVSWRASRPTRPRRSPTCGSPRCSRRWSPTSRSASFVEKRIVADVTATMTDLERRQTRHRVWSRRRHARPDLLVVILLSTAVARTVARPLTRLTALRRPRRPGRRGRAGPGRRRRVRRARAGPPGAGRRRRPGRDRRPGPGLRAGAAHRGAAGRAAGGQPPQRRADVRSRRPAHAEPRRPADRASSTGWSARRRTPTGCEQLYRLDHVSSRLRRNASSLVVLSGAAGANPHLAPLPLADVVRLALGEIEDYTRVDVQVTGTVMSAPGGRQRPGPDAGRADGERHRLLAAAHPGRRRHRRDATDVRALLDRGGPRHRHAGRAARRGERPAGAPRAARPGPDRGARPVRGGPAGPSARAAGVV